MPSPAPPVDLDRIDFDEIERLAGTGRPPVESWNPEHCGDSAMRIARDGSWHHEGRPINRPELVRLFASILRREPDGGFVLVTPVEKMTIEVEDCPFVTVELKSEGAGRERRVAFRLSSGGIVLAGPEHRLVVEDSETGPRPRLEVLPGLDARIARPLFYELAQIALEEGADPPGIWSDGVFFPLLATT